MGFSNDTNASAAPILLFIMALLVCGALYTLFFIEVGLPTFSSYIPASDSKDLTMLGIYALPMIIAVVGVISFIKAAQKRTLGGYR